VRYSRPGLDRGGSIRGIAPWENLNILDLGL
jgi:hypothetical protein